MIGFMKPTCKTADKKSMEELRLRGKASIIKRFEIKNSFNSGILGK